ncbi:EamA family transporter [Roseateles aquatilis]|uniref:EamA family transporter n=1 Tax=Roseateles aquatilis TaxID=431061 RepID=A0A246JMU3_9BURK|nr:DMT family transporter [Roseateles aquatilis]OWQ93823.1 EamA family transporter [Roseateles aquatilis]
MSATPQPASPPEAAVSHLSTHLRLIGMAVLWGASWPWGRVIAQAMPPLAAASCRFLLASLILLAWLHRTGRLAALRGWTASRWAGMTLAAATGVHGYATCFMMGLQHVPAGKGALVVTMNPVITMLLAAWIFRERLNRVIGLGMALAAVGAVTVITRGEPWHVLDGRVGIGELLLLGCVVCWVGYTLIGRRVMAGVDALTTTGVTAALGAAMLLLTSLAVEGAAGWTTVLHGPANAWLCLVMLAVGSTAVAYAWYFDGVRTLGAGAASGYITLVPVFGVVFSALWLGEVVDASLLIGGTMAIAGTAVMNFGRR